MTEALRAQLKEGMYSRYIKFYERVSFNVIWEDYICVKLRDNNIDY